MGAFISATVHPTLTLVDINAYDKSTLLTLSYNDYDHDFSLKSSSTNTILVHKTVRNTLIKLLRQHIDKHMGNNITLNLITNFIPIDNEHYGPGQEQQLVDKIDDLIDIMSIIRLSR